jgi:nitrous oxidase accessory protein NosD
MSSRNEIYLNNFINNIDNACSDEFNLWNSPVEITYIYNGTTYESYLGNYWSDYKEKYPGAREIDSTGIWDTPYSIDEQGDKYPLMEPFENYILPRSAHT